MSEARTDYEIVLLGIGQIRPTEESNPEQVCALLTEVTITQVWTHPIIVDEQSFAVMDGHHRLAVARRLGLEVVPAVMLSYEDPRVRLESWRPGEVFTPQQIRECARDGRLLPLKSTRHLIEPWPPQTRVQLSHLSTASERGARVDPALPPNSRVATLVPFYHRLGAHAGLRTRASQRVGTEPPEMQAPHPALRQLLQSDPAMAALLPAAASRIALGTAEHAPFMVKASGMVLLPPVLLDSAGALSAAVRWALETAFLIADEPGCARTAGRALALSLAHGAGLLTRLNGDERSLLLAQVPPSVARALDDPHFPVQSAHVLAWQASLVEGMPPWEVPEAGFVPGELSRPVEQILIAGGDSRLHLDPVTGLNRYGTVPRPRPEAVHFSSSTASSISDYGFMLCDMLRRDLLATDLRESLGEGTLRARTVDALAAEFGSLLSIPPGDADVAIAPSGTDTELLAVLLSLAADERGLTNIVIAPDETGRGVAVAAAGCYFDDVAASGAAVRTGEVAWPHRDIQVVQVAVRRPDGCPREVAEIDRELEALVDSALAAGRRVLLHVLASSKTGLSAPSLEAVGRMERKASDRIDVVVDACQMRNPMHEMGGWVGRGWLLQTSGSKFLTGPPFSAALLIPRRFRLRAESVSTLLAAAPGVGRSEDWTRWWRRTLPPAGASAASFGPLLRLLPAMAEAVLLAALPQELCQYAFRRLQQAIQDRLARSESLLPIDTRDAPVRTDGVESAPNLATHSIVSFTITADAGGGRRRTLDAGECQRLFELLNVDARHLFEMLSPVDRVKAAQQAHIGQPVTLPGANGQVTVLRLVVGARFFTIVGHAGPGAIESSLESEISDALRAVDKLELLARRWSEVAVDAADAA